MEENTLRLILLVVGVAIIAGIYFFDKFKKKPARRINPIPDFVAEAFEKTRKVSRSPRVEPKIDDALSDIEPMSARRESLDPEVIGSMLEEQNDPFESTENNELEDKPHIVNEKESVLNPEPERATRDESSSAATAEERPNLILQLNVTSVSPEGFKGPELLKALTELGLEYGEMGIFHCYDRDGKKEHIWFHLVNMVEPGTFPVGSMQDFQTPGVSLFFQTVEVESPRQVFDDMLSTAIRLADVLSGQVLNQQREPLTRQDLDQIGEQIQEVSGSAK